MAGLGDEMTSSHSDDLLALAQNDLDLSRVFSCLVGYCLCKIRWYDLRERQHSSFSLRYDLLGDYRDIALLKLVSLVFDLPAISLPRSSPFLMSGIPFT